jgi:hypothetical protein
MPLPRLCLPILLLTAAGCAGPMGTIHTDPTVAPVTAYDGSYQSTISVTTMASEVKGTNWCDTPGQPVVTVTNGKVSYTVPHPNGPSDMTTTFQATFANDGTFFGQVVGGTMSGQVSGRHLTGSIDGQGCVYAIAGDRT